MPFTARQFPQVSGWFRSCANDHDDKELDGGPEEDDEVELLREEMIEVNRRNWALFAQLQEKARELREVKEELRCVRQELEKAKIQEAMILLRDVMVWEYRVDDAGNWSRFKAQQNDEITMAYFDKRQSCTIGDDGKEYEIKFEEMHQRNCQTGRLREVRLNPNLPPHWITTVEDIIERWRRERAGSDGLADRGADSADDDLAEAKEGGTKTRAPKNAIQRAFWRFALSLAVGRRAPAKGPEKAPELAPETPLIADPDTFPLVKVEDREVLKYIQDLFRACVFHHDGPDGAIPSCEDPTCTRLKAKMKVVDVWHVENMELYLKNLGYCNEMRRDHSRYGVRAEPVSPAAPAKLRDLGKQCGIAEGRGINEQLLFHGTSFEVAQQICRQGFDHRVSNSGLYGFGTYFAAQSCKSHQYTCPAKDGGLSTVILARVALGDPYYTRQVQRGLARPPGKEAGEGCLLYDSVIARPGPMEGHGQGLQTHMEFVAFNERAAYPEYVVRYRLAE